MSYYSNYNRFLQPEDKKKSVREQFLKGISEAERRGKMLKEEQKQMKENVAAASKQVKNELCYNHLLAFLL